jgi:hypothetical protein
MTNPTRRTATVERYHVYGTMRYELRVMYRGRVLRWSIGNGSTAMAIVQNDPTQQPNIGWLCPVDVFACRAHAKRMGFTHVRFVGDWERRTKPVNGAL